MAVQQNRKTRSKRGMRRAHDGLNHPPLSFDSLTGDPHLRHHMTADGYYRGKQMVTVKTKQDKGDDDDDEE